jgi:hypothetical protein
MFEWQKLPEEQKKTILDEASAITGYPTNVIEKDWWVTVALKAVFATTWADNLVFKGGTSLSKAWNLIERFSEDIDLAIDRSALGFSGEQLSSSQIRKLRVRSAKFLENDFLPALNTSILSHEIDPDSYSLQIAPIKSNDVDPRVLRLNYNSITPQDTYLERQVLIEIGARSLREPCSKRVITSFITAHFPATIVADAPFDVHTVHPERTFLEKAFLLHEEFCKPPEKRRHERLSRHPYDLYRIMQSPHAAAALADKELFNTIVEHRKQMTRVRDVSYDRHTYNDIDFRPPADVDQLWKEDYRKMQRMIYGDRPDYEQLMDQMDILIAMFRQSGTAHTQKEEEKKSRHLRPLS